MFRNSLLAKLFIECITFSKWGTLSSSPLCVLLNNQGHVICGGKKRPWVAHVCYRLTVIMFCSITHSLSYSIAWAEGIAATCFCHHLLKSNDNWTPNFLNASHWRTGLVNLWKRLCSMAVYQQFLFFLSGFIYWCRQRIKLKPWRKTGLKIGTNNKYSVMGMKEMEWTPIKSTNCAISLKEALCSS